MSWQAKSVILLMHRSDLVSHLKGQLNSLLIKPLLKERGDKLPDNVPEYGPLVHHVFYFHYLPSVSREVRLVQWLYLCLKTFFRKRKLVTSVKK